MTSIQLSFYFAISRRLIFNYVELVLQSFLPLSLSAQLKHSNLIAFNVYFLH